MSHRFGYLPGAELDPVGNPTRSPAGGRGVPSGLEGRFAGAESRLQRFYKLAANSDSRSNPNRLGKALERKEKAKAAKGI
jgi:hypothetical protein